MVVIGVGEAFSETISDKVTVYKGPGDFKTSGKVTPLVLIKASAFQYIASSGPDGVVTHTAGPTSKYLTADGTCPVTGANCMVRDMFFAKSPTDWFGMYCKDATGTYKAVPMQGPLLLMPEPTAYVAQYDMSNPSGGPDQFRFTYFSSAPQMLPLNAPGVVDSDGAPGSLKLLLSIQIEPEKFVENNSPDGVGDLINSARVDWATGASSFPTVKATGAAIGIKIGTVTVLGVEPSEEAVDTPLGMLEKQALEKKLKMEMAVQSAIAKQEILLAGAYARSQNAVTTVSQIVNANVTAVSQLAGLAKGSGGSDRNYSRVFAACCCSVATKSSGGAWASLDASASSSLDINMLINSNMTATSTTRTEEKFSYAGPYESWTEFEEFRPL